MRALADSHTKDPPMPTVTSPNLTLSESNGIVTMTITLIPTLARSRLHEGPAAGDSDELKVQIRIHTHVPPEFTDGVYTDQEVL